MNKTQYEEVVEKLEKANIPDIDFDKYFKSRDEDNEKIRLVADFFDEITEYVETGDVIKGATLPFPKLFKLFRFRQGEVTLWSGYNGHKKSMIIGYCMNHIIEQGESVCVASFEMKPIKTINRMATQHTKKKNLTYDEYADFMEFCGNKFYIFDQQGGMSPERLYGVIFYCADKLGVKHFVIDSLMRVVAGEDKYNEQKDFVVKLCEIASKTGIHIHLVHHAKKPEKGDKVISNRFEAKGSGAISDNVHNSLIVWENKEKVKDMPPMVLKCDKQRDGEWEGMVGITFDAETLSFTEAFQ